MRRLVSALLGVLLVAAVPVAGASADAASPTITGPIPGTPLLAGDTAFDLASVGYTRSEFFLEGTASAYSSPTTLTSDGRWTVAPISPQSYKTRIVVNRPVDEDDFNGTVVVEWLNVSGGADAGPAWIQTHVELIRQGYAWVGVSAQAVGVNQLKCPALAPPACPAAGNPARYGTLAHPGDSYSYDIFSQAGQAILAHPERVLSGLAPTQLIGFGESQSAGRLVTYIDAAHPRDGVFDGFFVYSRGAGGAPLSQSPLPAAGTPSPTYIRTDLDVPVLVFNTETDAGGLQARQADSAIYRLWEVAGTAHFDQYGLTTGWNDVGERGSVAEWFDFMLHPTNQPSANFTCPAPINTGPTTFVLRAAMAHLDRWIADGTPPPMAPRLNTVTVQPVVYAKDANGNVLGGVRTPAVDAPVATLSGFGQVGPGSQFCGLFGTTVPLSEERLETLYGSHGGFVSAWSQATQAAVQSGFIVRDDARLLRVVGAQSSILT